MAYVAWSVVFGEQPSAAKWNILGTNDAYFDSLVGSGSATYVSYTPTFYNLTAGAAVITAKYCQLGKFVHYYGRWTFGAGSAVGTTAAVSLPVNIAADAFVAGENFEFGQSHFQDTGSAAYSGTTRFDLADRVVFATLNTSGSFASHGTTTSTSPFTWGSGDSISWNVIYPSV